MGEVSNNSENIEIKKKKRVLPWIAAVVVIAVLAVVICVVIRVSGSTERKMQRQMEMGDRYLDELNYEQAIVAFKAVIELDPNNQEAYEKLAHAYMDWAAAVLVTDPIRANEIMTEAEEYFTSAKETVEEGIRETVSQLYENIVAQEKNIGIGAEEISINANEESSDENNVAIAEGNTVAENEEIVETATEDVATEGTDALEEDEENEADENEQSDQENTEVDDVLSILSIDECQNVDDYIDCIGTLLIQKKVDMALQYAEEGYEETTDRRLQWITEIINDGFFTDIGNVSCRYYDAGGVTEWEMYATCYPRYKEYSCTSYGVTRVVDGIHNDEQDFLNNTEYERYYDENGVYKELNIREWRSFGDIGRVVSHVDYRVDNNGNEIFNKKTLTTWDENGDHVLRKEEYREDDSLSRVVVYTYSEDGRQIREDEYRYNAASTETHTYTEYIYDENGNRVGSKEYDNNGNLIRESSY